jgi:hypothetical protein
MVATLTTVEISTEHIFRVFYAVVDYQDCDSLKTGNLVYG